LTRACRPAHLHRIARQPGHPLDENIHLAAALGSASEYHDVPALRVGEAVDELVRQKPVHTSGVGSMLSRDPEGLDDERQSAPKTARTYDIIIAYSSKPLLRVSPLPLVPELGNSSRGSSARTCCSHALKGSLSGGARTRQTPRPPCSRWAPGEECRGAQGVRTVVFIAAVRITVGPKLGELAGSRK